MAAAGWEGGVTRAHPPPSAAGAAPTDRDRSGDSPGQRGTGRWSLNGPRRELQVLTPTTGLRNCGGCKKLLETRSYRFSPGLWV
ncbi:hypothetical protein Q9966_013869 [Columba livia]|nr:hypothetical protein Q9966_013869 [Columba livia]